MRPPAESRIGPSPERGAWCSKCSRSDPKAGGCWWRDASTPAGWRCWTCHPPAHSAVEDMEIVKT
jgi:hypothetical protein